MQFKPDPNDREPPSYGSSSNYTPPDPYPVKDLPAGSQGGGKEWIDANPSLETRVSYDEEVTREGITPWQVKKAAALAQRFGEYRLLLQR